MCPSGDDLNVQMTVAHDLRHGSHLADCQWAIRMRHTALNAQAVKHHYRNPMDDRCNIPLHATCGCGSHHACFRVMHWLKHARNL